MSKAKETWLVFRNLFKHKHNYKDIYIKVYKTNGKKYENKPMPYNVYGINSDYEQYFKIQGRIHTWFKAKLIEPLVILGRLFLGKHLMKDVSDEPQFKNLKVFSVAVENAVAQWNSMFRYSMQYNGDKEMPKESFLKMMNDKPSKILKFLKNFYITVQHNDTAYLAFHDMLMFEIWKQMSETYKDNDNLDHVLYNSTKIDELSYFVVQGRFPDFIEFEVSPMVQYKINVREILNTIKEQTLKVQPLNKPGYIKDEEDRLQQTNN